MKNLKRFVVKSPDKFQCDIDGKEYPLKQRSFIKLMTWNSSKHYEGSNQPIRMNYKINCCPKCFKKLEIKVNQIFKFVM